MTASMSSFVRASEQVKAHSDDFIVETCSLWDRQYSFGVLCVTDSFLFFQEVAGPRSLSIPLASVGDIKQENARCFPSISIQMQKDGDYLFDISHTS